jgi:hypothetical protein
MAKRLSVKNRVRNRDIERANKEGHLPKPHKIAVSRSKKALARKVGRMI